jgi:acetyl esterase/lipase
MLDPNPFHPDLFSPESVTDETRRVLDEFAQLLAGQPAIHEVEPAVTRAARAEGRSWAGPIVKLDQAQARTVPGPAGDIPIRVLIPDQVDGVYLHLHGGGWVLGQADQQDEMLWQTACAANLAVVSVDYRLAPEDPHPAGPDDCEAAALWLAQNAQREFGVDRLTIGGESAGGHLAAATLLRLRDRHSFTDFRGANLVYGVFDLSLTPSGRAAHDALLIPTDTMRWFASHFVPDESMLRDPDVSPLFADLHDLPPALFTVGTADPLLDDSLFMHQRWLAAGNAAALAVYPGGIHGFNRMPMPIARQANDRSHEFLRAAISD